ncbi:MAG: PHB depolymerase family esterase [Myxococcota bacterium]|nr:PHB depolymerase family esterase [Myxococcota bacterium]
MLASSCSRTALFDANQVETTPEVQSNMNQTPSTSVDSGTRTEVDNLPKAETFEVLVGDETRRYLLYVPEVARQRALPLVVMVNGGGGNFYPFPQEKLFYDLAESEGFVVARPISQQRPENEGEWQLNTGSSNRQDIDFMERLIEDIATDFALDTTRVYATGYSLGSMFTYEIACHLSTKFAAVASYAGSMPMNHRDCADPSAIGIMHIHGTQDQIIPYFTSWDWKNWDSVGRMFGVPGLVDHWQRKFACNAERQDGMRYVYENCEDNVRVEHFRLEGVDHGWPDFIDGQQTATVIWRFFEQFSL